MTSEFIPAQTPRRETLQPRPLQESSEGQKRFFISSPTWYLIAGYFVVGSTQYVIPKLLRLWSYKLMLHYRLSQGSENSHFLPSQYWLLVQQSDICFVSSLRIGLYPENIHLHDHGLVDKVVHGKGSRENSRTKSKKAGEQETQSKGSCTGEGAPTR